MFERTREYPTAVSASSSGGGDAVARAARWFLAQAQAVGGQPLLYFPSKQNLDAEPLLGRLTRERTVVTATWRTFRGVRWSGGPVLAVWPDEEHLALVADHARTRALCVIPWTEGDVTAWQRAATPERLGTQAPDSAAGPLVSDSVVVEGLRTLTAMVNHANNLAGSLDRRDAVAVLRTLHDGGHQLVAADVYAWALANRWPAVGSQRLKQLADDITEGKKPRRGGPSPLHDDALQQWRRAAEKKTTAG